jgi:hypothetical protein
MLGAFPAPSAVAQGRSAGIRVSAQVRDAAELDLIGAHAVKEADTRAAAAGSTVSESAAWRITSGRSGQVGLQLETVDSASGDSTPYVTICDDADPDPTACRRHRAPLLAVSTGGALPAFVVRVGGGASREAEARTSMRLTVAFIAF